MFYHVMMTTACNLKCRYCYGEVLDDFDVAFSGLDVDYSLPKKVGYSWKQLSEFCSKDADCVLTFYGGEPLICAKEIQRIMDTIKAKHFMIQTNGLLLDQLETDYINRFHTVLVSIDGDESLTDYYRGKGTFRKVISNLCLVTENGFQGELIARMTVMEQTDINKQVRWLLDNNEFVFSSVHWQLNAGFWENDYSRRNFKNWSENSYIPSLKQLAHFWVNQMETKGLVLKLYPFLGITNSLLNGKTSLLRCGGGWINYTIQTDGTIIPCPTMWGMKKYYLGHISKTDPLKLRQIPISKEPCTSCNILGVCGGRCLYANITKRWNDKEYTTVCNTVRSLVDAIETELPRIKQLISNDKVRLDNFDYTEYNGCEIIP